VVNQVGIVSGILLVYLAAFPSLTRPGYWRALVLLSLVFAAVLAGGLLAIGVESPRWLLRVGRAEEARVALQTLRGARTDVDAEMKELVATEAPDASSAAAGVSFSAALRRPATLRALALGMGMMAMQQGSGVTAIVFNTKQLFEGLDPPLDASGRVEFDRARVALIGATLVSVVQVLFTVISALSVERRGRRFFLLLSTYGLAASLLSLAAAYGADAATGVRIALVIVFFAFFSLGLGPLPYVVCAEIFPTQLRGALLSVCVLTLWVTSFVVTLLFNALLDALSPAGTFCLFAAVCAAGGVALHVWLPETKGRSLEEVQALFGAPREPEAHPLELLSRDSSQSALRA
jgi:SP family facilitated glucose transporter-like MFS transporter 8